MSRHLPEGCRAGFAIAAFVLTIITAVVNLVAVAFVIVPSHAITVCDEPPRAWADRHALIRWPAIILKNLLGVFSSCWNRPVAPLCQSRHLTT